METELYPEPQAAEVAEADYQRTEEQNPENEPQHHAETEDLPTGGTAIDIIIGQANRVLSLEMNNKDKIKVLVTEIEDLKKAINIQTNEYTELQKNADNIAELYKVETTCGREDLLERFTSIRQCTEFLESMLEQEKERFNSLEMDKNTIASVQLSHFERLAASEQAIFEKEQQATEMVQAMETEMQNLKSETKNFQHVIELKEKEIQNILKERDEKISKLQEELTTEQNMSKNKILELQSKISEVTINYDEQIRNQKTGFETQLSELQLKIDQFCLSDQKLTEQLTYLQLQLESQRKEATQLRLDLDSKKDRIREQEDSMTIYESKLNDSSTIITEMGVKINILENSKTILQNQIEDLKKMLTETEFKHQEVVESISNQWKLTEKELQDKNSTDQIIITEKQKEINTLREDIVKLQETHKMVIREYRETMQRTESEYSQQLKDTKLEVTNLEAKLEKEKKEKQVLEKQLATIKKELEKTNQLSQKSDKILKTAEEEKMKLKMENTTLKDQLSQIKNRQTPRPTPISYSNNSQNSQVATKKRKQVLSPTRPTRVSDINSNDSDSSDASIHIDPQLLARRVALMERMSTSTSRFSNTNNETPERAPNRKNSFSIPDSSSHQNSEPKQMRLRKSK